MKKLNKLSMSNLDKYQINNPSVIFGGGAGTCLGTCCPLEEDGTVGGCEDWEDDPENQQ